MQETTESNNDENWNVLTSRWMSICTADSVYTIVSPIDALRRASEIHGVVQSTPLDQFSAHRFLLTLLYWKAEFAGGVPELRSSLLRGELPARVLEEIYKESQQFRLYDPTVPFLQDTSITKRGETKSAASLFAELATGTNLAHFHHGDDGALRLCLACVTIGMLRVIPWSQAGGAGITPSIHGAPPIMALAKGPTLAATLGLNLIPLDIPAGSPQWSGHFAPTNSDEPIPLLEAFTWNPRRILLPKPATADHCWRCGAFERPTVGRVLFQKNDATKKRTDDQPFIWQDPAAFYRADTPYNPVKSIDRLDGRITLTGEDLQRLAKGKTLPTSQVGSSNPEHRVWTIVVPCTTGKDAKTFDHRQVALDTLVPESLHAALPTQNSTILGKRGCDGFSYPNHKIPTPGIRQLVRVANLHLKGSDWAILDQAAFKSLHEAPAAFDLFAGIYWPLRKRYAEFPARHTVWLFLKLMATTPEKLRRESSRSGYCPLSRLPRRQLGSSGNRTRPSQYPVGLPRGHQLETALRNAISANLRRRPPDLFDWEGFGHRLSTLID